MKKRLKIKWINLLMIASLILSVGVLFHDAFVLLTNVTSGLTTFGLIIDGFALLMAEASYEFLREE